MRVEKSCYNSAWKMWGGPHVLAAAQKQMLSRCTKPSLQMCLEDARTSETFIFEKCEILAGSFTYLLPRNFFDVRICFRKRNIHLLVTFLPEARRGSNAHPRSPAFSGLRKPLTFLHLSC